MFKIIGALVTFGASVLFGMKASFKLKERKQVLREALSATQGIENRLRCMCMPLCECFEESGGIFKVAAEFIKKGDSPQTAVKKAAETCEALKKEDKEEFFSFSGGLTARDCEGQIANVRMLSTELEKRLEEADFEARTKGALMLKGSALIGAAAVILML